MNKTNNKTMNKKSFFLGVVAGIVITFIGFFVIGIVKQNAKENDPVHYLEKPVSYENKRETSFKVSQVIGDAALATEAIKIGDDEMNYNGIEVLLLGENYYTDQIVTVKNPQRVGTYSYTFFEGLPMKTVPVIEGEME